MRYTALLLIAALTLPGCASRTKKYSTILNSWMGQDVSELIVSWGPPSQTYRLPDGRTSYTWNYYGGAAAIPIGNVAYAVNLVCTTTFVAGPDNKIQTWSFRGNAC
jgi:hypothetical protein